MATAEHVVPSVGTNFPTPFGKYLLTELLAVGGMAEVYRAKIFGVDGFEKEMVVKKILGKYAKKQSFVQMFVDEAKIAVALSHGNIVPIYELGEFAGAYYIAMEYVEGPTVLDLLRECFSHNKQLSPPYALYIAAEVAKGLSYAHNKSGADGKTLGIVHRDINPRNIVVTPAGEVKILDFGIARASTRRYQTASGVIKGTPGYMSPEQLYGFSVDHRSDLYCLGIILHELLTVRRLFRVKDVASMRVALENEPIPIPSRVRPDLALSVDDLLARMLALKPEDRFQDAGALEEALRQEIARSATAVTGRGLAELVTDIQRAVPRPVETSPAMDDVPLPAISQGSQTAPIGKAASAPAQELSDPAAAMIASLPKLDPRAAAEADVAALFAEPPRAPRQVLSQPEVSAPIGFGDARALRPHTQVLAKNDEVAWANMIGEDAELLAIAKAGGLQPRPLWRTLLVPAIVLLVLVTVLAIAGRDQIPGLWRRIVERQQVRLGSLVIKTYPSGAEVTIDGQAHGRTPLRINSVDVDAEHTIIVAPVGEPEVKRVIGPGDWEERGEEMMAEIRIGYDKLPPGKQLLEE
ncbi:MAG: protein kinase [Deltaproteobacteria bacterium]|nr:protein kinase [Deltaproteobacteria bacterium]